MSYQVKKPLFPQNIVLVYVVLILLFLLDYGSWMGWFRRSVIWGLSPLTKTSLYIVEQGERFNRYVGQIHRQAMQNLDMQREIAELTVLSDKALLLEEENKWLAAQAKIIKEKDEDFVIGEVIFQGNKWRVYVENEVPVGSMVLHNSRVVGVVVASSANICEVSPVGSSGAEIVVRAGDVVIGKVVSRGSVLEVINVSKDVPISASQILVTAGEFGLVIPGYPVAQVSEVIDTPESLFKSVRLESLPSVWVGTRVLIGGIKL